MSSTIIQAARLRLLTAQKFYGTSTQMLQHAKDQLEIAQNELTDATEYLEELESRNTKSETVFGSNNNGNEIVSDIVYSSSSVDIVRKVSSDSPIQATTSNNSNNNVNEVEDSEQDNHPQGVYVDYLRNRETEVTDNTTSKERKHNIKAQSVVVSPTSYSNNKSDYNTSITDQSTLSSHSPCNWVEVSESGIPQINGRYHRFEISDGVASFSKIDTYEGREAIFTISRWDQFDSGSKKWCITGTVPPNKQLGFYVAYAPSFVRHPPLKNWMSITENGEPSSDYIGQGNQNVPTIMHEPDPYISIQNLPMMNVNGKEGVINESASKSSTKKGRQRLRSVSNPRSTRNVDRSASTGRYRMRI